MNKVYEAVADCRKTFVEMSFAFTHDINEIEEAVQECLMYFLQMNPTVLIYDLILHLMPNVIFYADESLSIRK